MKALFLTTILYLNSLGLWAQIIAPDKSVNQTLTKTDSVRALHRLFLEKRKRGLLRAGLATVAAGATKISIAIANEQSVRTYPKVMQLGLLGLEGTFAAIGITQAIKFSKRHEVRVIAEFERGQPLPPYVRRRFTAAYFPALR